MTAISKKRIEELECVLGLDCSKYQKDINWSKAKADGIEFAFVKITEGTTVSEDEVYNIQARVLDAQKNGVKISYYHFARPGNISDPESDAIEEVTNAMNHLKVLPKADLPFVLDIESYSTTIVWDNKIEHMDRFIIAFIAGMKSNGISTIIYSYKSFIDSNSTSKFGNYPLWLAAYPNNPEATLPLIPKGWTDWKIWQFTDKGRIDGYVGDLDLNIMKKDFFDSF